MSPMRVEAEGSRLRGQVELAAKMAPKRKTLFQRAMGFLSGSEKAAKQASEKKGELKPEGTEEDEADKEFVCQGIDARLGKMERVYAGLTTEEVSVKRLHALESTLLTLCGEMSDIVELSLFHLEMDSFMAIFGSNQGLGRVARIGQVMTYPEPDL